MELEEEEEEVESFLFYKNHIWSKSSSCNHMTPPTRITFYTFFTPTSSLSDNPELTADNPSQINIFLPPPPALPLQGSLH